MDTRKNKKELYASVSYWLFYFLQFFFLSLLFLLFTNYLLTGIALISQTEKGCQICQRQNLLTANGVFNILFGVRAVGMQCILWRRWRFKGLRSILHCSAVLGRFWPGQLCFFESKSYDRRFSYLVGFSLLCLGIGGKLPVTSVASAKTLWWIQSVAAVAVYQIYFPQQQIWVPYYCGHCNNMD